MRGIVKGALALIVGLAAVAALAVITLMGFESENAADAPVGTCGTGNIDVPAEARPWMKKAAEASGLPEAYLSAIARQESDFRPALFAMDSNGGTWGLFQINREEWHRFYPQGDNPGGTPHGITDPMIHAEYGGKYLKARYEHVKKLQAKNPDTEWGKLPPLDALVIAHNAGEGNLMKYPSIPSITRKYLANIRQWFTAGPCPDGQGPEIRPPIGKLVSPIPANVSGVVMTASYPRYPSGGAHYGVDLAKGGDGSWTIQSICDGTVVAVKVNPAYANSNAAGVRGSTNYVWVDCGNRVYIGYGHFYARQLNPAIKAGVRIGAGTPLFPQGNQGNSRGSHLHLQISTVASMEYSSSATVHPATYLAKFGVILPALVRS